MTVIKLEIEPDRKLHTDYTDTMLKAGENWGPFVNGPNAAFAGWEAEKGRQSSYDASRTSADLAKLLLRQLHWLPVNIDWTTRCLC